MIGYKIFSFLYRFSGVCQYDFYSFVCFYVIFVTGSIVRPYIPLGNLSIY